MFTIGITYELTEMYSQASLNNDFIAVDYDANKLRNSSNKCYTLALMCIVSSKMTAISCIIVEIR